MNDSDRRADYDGTLDPEDWEALRRLGHRMVDDMIGDLRTLRDQPVWQPIPESVLSRFEAELPTEPQGAEAAYEDFRRYVRPYPRGNNHPRFWGWVNGTGLPLGMLGDLLAAAMNPSVGPFENAASLVEAQVLDWLKQMLGFPAGISSVLTSGTSMSSIIALAVARDAQTPVDLRRDGVSASPARLMLYGSNETHSSIQKAVELLGLGRASLRQIQVGRDYRIDLGALTMAIADDRRAGLLPFCVIGNVGTVNTGSVDDLEGLANICERERLWLHVDGAFGALAWLCPEMRDKLGPLQRADSLAFDLHKWMYLPYDVGCVFVKDAVAHRSTFAVTPSYLSATPARPNHHVKSFPDYSIELSRRFRALKVWLCLKEHGVHRFERQIRTNIRQAQYLAERARTREDLELAAPVSLNVVCFRFVTGHLSPDELDALNLEILARLQEEGIVFTSHTMLEGRVVLRIAVTNHRSRTEDFDLLVDEVIRHGAATLAAWGRDDLLMLAPDGTAVCRDQR